MGWMSLSDFFGMYEEAKNELHIELHILCLPVLVTLIALY